MPTPQNYAMEIKPALRQLTRVTWISIAVLALVYQLAHGWDFRNFTVFQALLSLLTLILSFIVFIFVHEFTHALGFVYAGKVSWKDIKFGVFLKALSPYTHCKVGIPITAYKLSILLPVLLGAVPLVWGLAIGNMLIYLLGIFTFISGYGDLLVLWVLREAPADLIVKDHPEKLGCEVVDQTL